MTNIIKIFKRDMQSIIRHFIPLLICGALVIIASCYAVFNIYSNWDPYGNTDQLTILVYNCDKGYTDEDGNTYNQGESIVENLKENKSIHWQVADTKNALLEAVTNGDVYAGIVIGEAFSKDMLGFLSSAQGFQKPEITYYENGKKNAIAVKVTDTAVETLQDTINKTFLETVVQTVLEEANNRIEESGEENAADLIIAKLSGIRENLSLYDRVITDFMDGNVSVHEKINLAQSGLASAGEDLEQGIGEITAIQGNVSQTIASYYEFSEKMNQLMNQMQNTLTTITADVEQSKLLTGDIEQLNQILEQTGKDINALYDATLEVENGYQSETMKNFLLAIRSLNASMDVVEQLKVEAPDLTALDKVLNDCAAQVASLQDTYNKVITPELTGVMETMNLVMEQVTSVMETLQNMTGNAGTLFSNVDTVVSYTEESLVQVQAVVGEIIQKIEYLEEEVKDASESEKMQILMGFLTGDAQAYGKYFSEIIKVDTTVVFPVENYGSACAVFYVVLALYVLALILTSELKVEADTKGLEDVRDYQTYFGRYLTFWLLGFIQSVFLSAFVLFVMKIQCEHKVAFFIVNALISFVFTSITYSCVKTFGLVYGRVFATILVIFQMSTGGCTYSIEQIPSSMRWLSPYMPFTYCSNALREVCFGYTGYDLSIYLLKLMLFAAVAIFFGLVVRKSFFGCAQYIDRRLLETGIMGVPLEDEISEEEETYRQDKIEDMADEPEESDMDEEREKEENTAADERIEREDRMQGVMNDARE